MLRFKLYVIVFLAFHCLSVTSYGANIGDDKEPFYAFDDPFWNTNGAKKPFGLYDGKNYQLFNTQIFYATSNLQSTHDIDSQGLKHGHWHVRDTFVYDLNKYGTDYTTEANAYWNVVFQAGIQPNMVADGGPTTRTNCFAYALGPLVIDRGTYTYWIDDANAFAGFGGAGEATAAFSADAHTENIRNGAGTPIVAIGDVYVYTKTSAGKSFINHATTVFSFSCGPPAHQYLTWKYSASGYYTYGPITPTFNTPMYIFNTPLQEGQPLPMGQWNPSGAGSETQLYPSGKKWHADPKQS
jgi:hypothetical protein